MLSYRHSVSNRVLLKSIIEIFLLLPVPPIFSHLLPSPSVSSPSPWEAPQSTVLACGAGRGAGHPGAREHHARGLCAGSGRGPRGPIVPSPGNSCRDHFAGSLFWRDQRGTGDLRKVASVSLAVPNSDMAVLSPSCLSTLRVCLWVPLCVSVRWTLQWLCHFWPQRR